MEVGLAAPATAEQATPEEMPRPIHLFLQLLPQPTPPLHDAAGPSTSSTQLPSAEEPAKPSTRADNPATTGHEPGHEAAQRCRSVAGGNIGARTRGGITAKSCGREGGPSRLPRRARPSSGPTRVGSCNGACESTTRRISASNRFAQCGAARAA